MIRDITGQEVVRPARVTVLRQFITADGSRETGPWREISAYSGHS